MYSDKPKRIYRHRGFAFRHRGFSFIELMVVIVILGILAGAVVMGTRHYIDKAKENRAKTDLSTFNTALSAYYAETGHYPTSEEGLSKLAPKFIEKLHNDPWGNPYQYNAPGRNGPYEVLSLGAAGKEGEGNLSSDDLESKPADTAKVAQ